MKPFGDPLWKDVWRVLRNHRKGDFRGRTALYRLVRKHFGEDLPGFGQWLIRKEIWSMEELDIRTRASRHSRAEPKRPHGPVLLAERDDRFHIIDGSNRVNLWIRDGDRSMHDVLIFTVDRPVDAEAVMVPALPSRIRQLLWSRRAA